MCKNCLLKIKRHTYSFIRIKMSEIAYQQEIYLKNLER